MIRICAVTIPFPINLPLQKHELYFRIFSRPRTVILPQFDRSTALSIWEPFVRLVKPLPKLDLSQCHNALDLNQVQVELDTAKYYELSLAFANRCLELNSAEPLFWSNRASLLHGMARLADGLKDIEMALKISPDNIH